MTRGKHAAVKAIMNKIRRGKAAKDVLEGIVKTKDGGTPLHFAAALPEESPKRGDILKCIVDICLLCGEDNKGTDSEDRASKEKGEGESESWVLMRPSRWIESRDRAGDTPLHVASRNGFGVAMEYLIHTAKANPDLVNNSGSSFTLVCFIRTILNIQACHQIRENPSTCGEQVRARRMLYDPTSSWCLRRLF